MEFDREHPARPDQLDESFDKGMDEGSGTDEAEPNFARGESLEPPDGGRTGRFSEGQEELPETPEKVVERRFSEGQEESPASS